MGLCRPILVTSLIMSLIGEIFIFDAGGFKICQKLPCSLCYVVEPQNLIVLYQIINIEEKLFLRIECYRVYKLSICILCSMNLVDKDVPKYWEIVTVLFILEGLYDLVYLRGTYYEIWDFWVQMQKFSLAKGIFYNVLNRRISWILKLKTSYFAISSQKAYFTGKRIFQDERYFFKL